MVGSKENYKFDVGVKGLIIYLLGIIVSCFHMFLHASRFETILGLNWLSVFFSNGFDQHNTMSIHV